MTGLERLNDAVLCLSIRMSVRHLSAVLMVAGTTLQAVSHSRINPSFACLLSCMLFPLAYGAKEMDGIYTYLPVSFIL